MVRCARPAAIALLVSCIATAALAGPIVPGARSQAATWEEFSASRRDGFGLGAYPLPARPSSGDMEVEPSPAPEGEAKDRWLRRHYQWLRALRGVAIAELQESRQADAAQTGLAAAPGNPVSPPGRIRLGEMTVLYDTGGDDRAIPHLLDDGARTEDPELALVGGEAFEFVVADRLSAETAQIVSQFFAPLSKGLRSFVGAGREVLGGGVRTEGPRIDLAELGQHFGSATPGSGGGQQRAQPAREVPTLFGFISRIAVDILSAPTTYLLSLLSLLGWLVLRATVFSRS